MSLINGKLTAFTFNSADVPFKSSRVNVAYGKVEVTDNSSDNVEQKTTRYTAEIELSGVIYKTTDKQIGKDLKLTFDGVDYKTTALSFEETFGEIPIAHGSIAGNATELAVSLSERKMTAEIWQEDSVAEPALGSEEAATVLFATGVSAAGNLTLESKNIEGEVKGNQKVSLSGFFNGTVTQTSIGLTAGTSATATLTLADGSVTDKAVTGTAILVSKKVSATVDGDVNFTYMFKFSGAITETLKADA